MNHKPLTVLQIIPRLVSGGAERSSIDIAQALVKNGHRAIIISQGGRYVEELTGFGGIHVTLPVSSKSPWVIYKNIAKIRKVIRDYQVDIVHARSRAPAWSGYYAAKKEQVKFITTYHGLYGESNFLKKIYNKIMVRGDGVIAVSDFIAEQLKTRYPDYAHHVHTVHRGVNLVHYSPELVSRQRIEQLLRQWSLSDDMRNVILLPGRITQIKGHHLLIDAVKILLKKRDDFVCVCPGDIHDGKDNYAQKLLARLQSDDLNKYILLPGGCLDMPAAYAISHIVTAPTTKPEAFGRIPVESQLMGKPIVASRHGGFCETIIDDETGFLFTNKNAESFADALDKALSLSDAKRAEMSMLGRKRVTDMYCVSRMCDETLKIYNMLMGGNSCNLYQEFYPKPTIYARSHTPIDGNKHIHKNEKNMEIV